MNKKNLPKLAPTMMLIIAALFLLQTVAVAAAPFWGYLPIVIKILLPFHRQRRHGTTLTPYTNARNTNHPEHRRQHPPARLPDTIQYTDANARARHRRGGCKQ
jgi:hypothetical protein